MGLGAVAHDAALDPGKKIIRLHSKKQCYKVAVDVDFIARLPGCRTQICPFQIM